MPDEGVRAVLFTQPPSKLRYSPVRYLTALGPGLVIAERRSKALRAMMYPILIAVVSVSILTILLLLWIRAGRRKKEIKDLKSAIRRLKDSDSAYVKRNNLNEMRRDWNEALKKLGGRINDLQSRVSQLKHRVDQLEGPDSRGNEEAKSEGDSRTHSAGFEKLDSGLRFDREDQSDYQSEKTGQSTKRRRIEADYNQVLTGDLDTREFQSRYEPIVLGIKNEKERLDHEEAPVLLEEDERGQYLSVETNSGYFIVPKPGITLEDPTRRQAGYDEVFQCGRHPHNHPYVVQRLRQAAQFVKRTDGTYSLTESGRIELERYD